MIASLEGQLSGTIQYAASDLPLNDSVVSALRNRVGRLLLNGFPTGVEVCAAMIHGGPFPATTDGRSTSVGTLAIHRFTRPFCYQSFVSDALPAELKDGNPLGIWRLVDGKRTQA